MTEQSPNQDPRREPPNPADAVRTAAKLVGVVLFMGAMAWASVPFYDWFCRVTGYGGTTNVADGASETVLDREITVRFDASRAADMPWDFKPVEQKMTIRIGETGLAFYEAHNPMSYPVAGSANFNVSPYQAGLFFSKIDCFCFEEQVLQPGETVLMPVSFFVDPEIVEDRDAQHFTSITLSYTFHRIDLPEEQAALTTD